jgi:hypothetical protein
LALCPGPRTKLVREELKKENETRSTPTPHSLLCTKLVERLQNPPKVSAGFFSSSLVYIVHIFFPHRRSITVFHCDGKRGKKKRNIRKA